MPEIGVLAHAIAVAAYIYNVAVMHEAIDECGGHDFIAQDLAPLLEALIRGEHGGGMFVACVNQLEEEHSAIAVHRQITDLIDDEQRRVAQYPKSSGQLTCGTRLF